MGIMIMSWEKVRIKIRLQSNRGRHRGRSGMSCIRILPWRRCDGRPSVMEHENYECTRFDEAVYGSMSVIATRRDGVYGQVSD